MPIDKNALDELKIKADAAERAYKEAKIARLDKTSITEEQFDSAVDTIVHALNTLSEQLQVSRAKGSIKAKNVVDGFGGEGKFNSLVMDLAGLAGEVTATGVTLSETPLVLMAGAAKGVYKKVKE